MLLNGRNRGSPEVIRLAKIASSGSQNEELMELTREKVVDIIQNEPMGQIYVKSPESSNQAYE